MIARFRPRLALAAALAATLCVCAGAGRARADTLEQAKAQATAIAAQIDKLRPQVEQALADYDTALAGVGQAISTSVAAERIYEALQAQAEAARAARNANAVALYESGGPMALYAAALRTGDPSMLRKLPMVSGVFSKDAAEAATAAEVARAAKQKADAANDAIDASLATASDVDERLQALQTLLAQEQALLDTATEKAKRLQALRDAAAAVAAQRAAAARANANAAASAAPYPIPPAYRALYQRAATTCPGLSWTILAAIGQVETHHGQGGMVSSAGALGPMQFLPRTFQHYAVDGDGDGVANIMDPADAIYSAARYLCANGAGQGGQELYSAIWHYNHAAWYVQLVLALAAKIS